VFFVPEIWKKGQYALSLQSKMIACCPEMDEEEMWPEYCGDNEMTVIV
jgi:hypothetical protein